MINEIKRTPITWNGKDGWEILIRNSEPANYCVCDLCMYSDWSDYEDTQATCLDVHGCGHSAFSYFIFKPS